MPCRPTPEEEAWAANDAREQAERLLGQRVVTLALLRRLLVSAGAAQDDVSRVMRLADLAPEHYALASNDERAIAIHARQQAEIQLCVARFALLQIVPLLPLRVTAPLFSEILVERRDHLGHRVADCAAEVATLSRRIADLTGTGQHPADVVALQAELDRLRALSPEQLLSQRDFSAEVACPLCQRTLPTLPGVSQEHLAEIVEAIARRELLVAIKRVRDLTGLGLKESKDYVQCPHGNGLQVLRVPPPATGLSPFRCPRCGQNLPRLPNLTPHHLDHLVVSLAQDRWDEVFSLLRQVTGWDQPQAKRFVQCPHPLP